MVRRIPRKSKKAKHALKIKQNSAGRSVEQLEPRLMLEGIDFIHPGVVNTSADYDRMVSKVAAQAQPWLSGYNALISDSLSQLGISLNPLVTVIRGGDGQNFGTMTYQIATAYQSALRWKVSGDTRYADQAVNFLNAWSSTNTTLTGNADRFLASGLYGYTWAATAELMHTYSGWAAADVTAFQNYLLNVYYPLQHSFLTVHNGAYDTNYWANWDLANIEGMMAAGIFTDRHDIYQEAMNYLYNGNGNGTLDNVVYYLHQGNLAQWQESGRDQGHTLLGMQLFGSIAQMAWCQGDDLFSYNNNQFLAGAEYIAKYNSWHDVPFTSYSWVSGAPGVWYSFDTQTGVGSGSRGNGTVGYELIYNHYVNLMGYDAPYSEERVLTLRPEWGSGNGDGLGFGTLTFAQDPLPTGQTPKGLTAVEKDAGNIELNWFGAPYATSYKIYRSTSEGGTYSLIASGITDLLTYTDFNLAAGTYYYKVTGVTPSGETGASNIVSATSTSIIQTQLLFNETSGTTAADASGNSHNGTLLNGAYFTTGKTGNAVSLDGADDYVALPENIVEDYNDFTISAWVYLDSASTWARVFDFGDSTNRWMMLSVKNGSGVPEFSTTSVYGYNKQALTGNSALPLNQWVHLAVTLSGKVGKLYVNGVLVGASANMEFSPLQIDATKYNWLGRSQYSSDPYLDGKIDDFRIYRGALKAGEIYTLATGLTAPAVPAAPASLIATAVPGYTINLSWSAVSGATNGYSVRRATSSGGPYTTIAANYNGTTFSDTWRAAGTTYYYVVTAANTGGDSAYSPQASAVALPNLPGTPTNLTTTSASATSVLLTWSAGPDATTYNIKRATVSGGPYTTVATSVTGTSYTNTGLTTGTTYYYVVSGINVAGESANSNESSVIPTDLNLQLKFDDGAGTTADDVSTNNRSGTLVNDPLWTTSGKINRAVDLDGTNDYVSLPTGILNGVTSSTIAAWVNLDTLNMWSRIFDFGTSTSSYMFITPQGATGVVRFAITISGNTAEQQINGTAALSTGVWTHVAVTLNGSVGTLYVNGVQVGQNTTMTLNPNSLGSTTNNYIGKSQFADPYLNGKIDDFRIYAHAFSASEISTLATTTRPTAPTGLTATLVNTNEADLAWNAVSGATGGYSVIRATSVSGPFTILATHVTSTSYHDTGLTVNPATGTTYYYYITAENAGGDSPYSLTASINLMPPMPDTPINLVSVLTNTSGSITLSWTAAANAGSYTVKRASSSAGPYSVIASGVTATTYTNSGLTNGTTYYYVIAAVNATGTSDDSNSIAATATDFRVHLKFNESSGTSAADSSGNSLNGTLVNGPVWTTGRIFNGVALDGSNDYVSLPNGVVNGLTDFSISTWVYINALSIQMRVFDFGTGTNVNMFLTPSNGSAVRFAITTGSWGSEQAVMGTSTLPTGVWTHVAVTLSGGVGTLYVNGSQVGQNTAMTLNPSSLGVLTQNYIGKSQYSGDAYLNGRVDDFRIYNRALTSMEVNTLATTLAPSAPTGLTATSGDASVSLSWSAVATATSYNVKRSLTSGGPYTTVASGLTTTSYTNTGLTNGTRYYYIVTAVNVASESVNSSQVYATPNAAPTDISLSNTTVAENLSAGTEVGTFSTTDPGLPAAPFTYTLVSGEGGTDNGSFSIDASGHLLTAEQFDYETKASYSIRVRTTDQGGLWYEEAFTIFITDVPETRTWDGGSLVNNLWSTSANWVGNLAPTTGDSLIFPAGMARMDNFNNFTAGTIFGSITFSGAGYQLSGNSFAVTDGIHLNNVALTIDVGVSQSMQIDGSISGAGGITKTGGGELILYGTGYYGLDTTVAEGKLRMGRIGTVSQPTYIIEVQAGARLEAAGAFTQTLNVGTGGKLVVWPLLASPLPPPSPQSASGLSENVAVVVNATLPSIQQVISIAVAPQNTNGGVAAVISMPSWDIWEHNDASLSVKLPEQAPGLNNERDVIQTTSSTIRGIIFSEPEKENALHAAVWQNAVLQRTVRSVALAHDLALQQAMQVSHEDLDWVDKLETPKKNRKPASSLAAPVASVFSVKR